MGEVWLAEDTRLGRKVALKVLPADFADDSDRHQRFEREAKLLASLNHANIATLHGLEHVDGQHVLVMELIEGEGLDVRIAGGPLPVDEVVAIGLQIAIALEVAHHGGIVHRDLKPANVMLRSDGTVKVLDFGLAKSWHDGGTEASMSLSPTMTRHATVEGVILGTAAYMAPEQARGKAVDHRADVWAFGVVLWEMLTGRLLFKGETVSDVLAAVLCAEPDFGLLPRALPRGLRRLLDRCLERDPKHRLQCMGDVRVELERVMDDDDGDDELSSRPARWPAAVGAIGLAAAVVALVWVLMNPGPGPPRLTSLEVSSAGYKEFGNSAISPDGRWVAYTLSAGDAPVSLRSLDSFEVQDLRDTAGAYNPFFSPDSRHLVVFDNSGFLVKVSVDSGSSMRLPAVIVGGAFNTGCWHPSEVLIVTGAVIDGVASQGLSLVPDSGGQPISLTSLTEGEFRHSEPAVVPGTPWILFTVDNGTTYEVWAVSLENRQRRLVLKEGQSPRMLDSEHLLAFRESQGAVRLFDFDSSNAEVEGEGRVVLSGVADDVRDGGRFAVSTTGTLIYSDTGRDNTEPLDQVVWVDRSGGIEAVFPDESSWRQPRISKDGRHVLVRRVRTPSCDLWTYDIVRETLSRVTFEQDTHDPLWGPNGDTILFSGDTDPGRRVYEVSADGTGQERVIAEAEVSLRPSSWSSNGRRLALTASSPSMTGDVWVLDLDRADGPSPFLDSRFSERFPAFSPDGRWMVYASDESGRFEVYVRPYPGPGGRIQVSSGGGSEPRWSGTGTEIFFRRPGEILAVSVTTVGSELVLGRPQKLFEGNFRIRSLVSPEVHAYDVAADGSRFLMVKQGSAAFQDNDLRIVLGWGASVKDK